MRILRTILMVAIILVGLWIVSKRLNVFPKYDFVEYWASGKLNFSGGDPYNADQMYKLEQSVGWTEKEALMMWNPPWTLPFAMVFGLFPYSFSRMLWFLFQLVIIIICAVVLWETYGGEKRREWIAWIALLSFGPMLHTIQQGQVTVLVLFGSVGFIYFLQREQDLWAGGMASLVLIKPHLLYLFVVSIFIWAIANRRIKVLIGMAGAVVLALGISWIFNPFLITQYIQALRSYPPEGWITATIGSILRMLLGPDKFYLQFLPPIIGTGWFLVYWFKRNKTLDWKANLPLIISVSVVTSAYGWAHDVSLCVWAVVQIAVLFNYKLWSPQKVIIFVSFWSVSLLNTFLSVSQHWFWWLSSFFLVWYLLSYLYLTKQNEALNSHILPISA